MRAIGVLTLTFSVPAGTRILATLPSSTASTSIVALSVSISAMTSPAFTSWPSLTSHLVSVPSSMVGDSAGIRTSVGIAPSDQDVGGELGDVGLGIGERELGCRVDFLAHLAVDGFQLVLADAAVDQPGADLLDRVLRLAHMLHLLAGAVLCGIGHRVAAVAVGHHLEDERPLAGTRMLDGACARRANLLDVHAVDVLTRNGERQAALGQIRRRRRALDRGAHRILVVLDDEHGGQLPQLRHVEGLVDLPLVGGAVAEVCEADPAIAAIEVGEGEPGAERHAGADNTVAAVEAFLGREHVHRPAFALRAAVPAPGELGHDALRSHADGKRVPMITVGGDHLVVWLERHLHADDDRFLPDVEMTEAADMPHAVELARLLLEAANKQHLAISVEALLAREDAGRGFPVGAVPPARLSGAGCLPAGCSFRRHHRAPCKSRKMRRAHGETVV